MRIRRLLILIALLLVPGVVFGQAVPQVVRFSGTVDLSDATVVLTFALYRDQAGGDPLWSETHTAPVDASGRYAVVLGSVTGFAADVFARGDARWLGVRVAGQEERPRVLLVSVPYALKAADAETIGGRPLSAFVLAGEKTGVGADGLTYVDARVLSSGLSSGPPSPQGGSGVAGGAGTPGYLGVFTDPATLGNSALYQSGTNIGLNTIAPAVTLHVAAVTTSAPAVYVDSFANGVLGTLPMLYRSARGTPGAPSAVQVNDILGGLAVRGYGATTWSSGRGQVMYRAAENWTDAAQGTFLQMTTTPIGSAAWTERLRITPDGNVGIGTTTPVQKLSVAGMIESTTGGVRFPDGTTQTSAAQGADGNFTATGHFALPNTTNGTTGVLTLGGNAFLHDYGSSTNAFVGARAGGAFTAVGTQNTGVGYQALYSLTTGTNNSAFGANALSSNTTGLGNTAIGTSALTAATTANGNIAVGDTALGATSTGSNNVAFGFHALWKNTTGAGNDGVGYYSLSSNTLGQYNTGIGDTALAYNTIGNFNTALGRYAGLYNATGSNNLYLGYNAGPDSGHTALTNTIAIGANALVSQNNTLILGGTGANAVNVGIGTSTPAQALSVVGTIESTTGGIKFPDGTTQATAGMSVVSGDVRYLQLAGGTVAGEVIINHSSGTGYALAVHEGVSNGIYLTQSANFAGVYAKNTASGSAWGVSGIADSSGGYGVTGSSNAGIGVQARTATGVALSATASGTGDAANFTGDVSISGTLSKTAGSFRIDHPLDPEHKYLSHSFVESPDMKNIYDGMAVLDADGQATVTLPEWFGALNRDFRYQLTAIGGPGPNLHVAREIQDNRFAIAGGTPGSKVSWMVTGIRRDAYANAHRIQVEEDKPAAAQGLYLHPDLFGQPDERRIQKTSDANGLAERPIRK
jgi:hypothetical protein